MSKFACETAASSFIDSVFTPMERTAVERLLLETWSLLTKHSLFESVSFITFNYNVLYLAKKKKIQFDFNITDY